MSTAPSPALQQAMLKGRVATVHKILREPQTIDQDVQFILHQAKGGYQATKELPPIECPKGRAVYFLDVKKFTDEETGEEIEVPITRVLTGTEKPVVLNILGWFSNLKFNDNKKRMDLYQKYERMAILCLLVGLAMVDIFFHVNPPEGTGDVLEFWKNPWLMGGLCMIPPSLVTMEILKRDSSMAVFELTVEHEETDKNLNTVYVCTSCKIPMVKKMELLGTHYTSKVLKQFTDVVSHIRAMTAEGMRNLETEIIDLRNENTILRTNRSAANYLGKEEAQAMNRRTDYHQTLVLAALAATSFIVSLALLLHYGVLTGGG